MSLCDLIDERGSRYVCKKFTPDVRDKMLDELPIEEFEFLFRMGLFKGEIMKLFSKDILSRKIRESSFNTMMLICDLFPIEVIEKVSFRHRFSELTYSRIGYYLTYYQSTMNKFLVDGYISQAMICKAFEKNTLDQIIAIAKKNPYLELMVSGLTKMVVHSLFPIRNGSSFNETGSSSKIQSSAQKAYCKGVVDNILSFIYPSKNEKKE